MDPTSHRIYLSAATIDEKAAPAKKNGRRPYVAGSFSILVVGE
jgi:hypothetical protein